MERGTQRWAQGGIRLATNEDVGAWTRWRHRTDDEDRSWDWRSIYGESSESGGRHECYAAWADGELQGLMALDLQPQNAQEADLITIDYLSTNPANRSARAGLKY